MRFSALLTLCILCFCTYEVSSESVQSGISEGKNGEKVERFSVEKTLELAKTVPSGQWWGPFSATFDRSKCPLNPDALPEMYRILDDSKKQADWDGIVSYIAVLGNDQDVDKLEKLLQRYKGKTLDFGEETLFYSVVCAIAAMDRYNVPKARDVIDSMMRPDYWQNLNVSMQNGRTGVTVFGITAIKSKSNNADPSYKEKVKKVLEGIQDTAIKKLYTEYADVALKNHNKLIESKRTGDWTIYYGKPKPTPTPSIIITRYYPPQSSYDALYTSATLWNVSTPLDTKAEQVLCKEALDAFKAALQATIKGDAEYLVTHTSVDGRPLLLKDEQTPEEIRHANIQKILDPTLKMKEKWQSLIPVARAFQGKALEPSEHFVYQCPSFGKGDNGTPLPPPPPSFYDLRKYPKGFDSLLVLRFRYDDLKDVAKKYPEIFNNKGRIPSVSENGEPYVVMIWENEQWYWNPFGM